MEHLLRHCEKVAVGPYSRDARALAHEVIDTISAGVPPEQLILPGCRLKRGCPTPIAGATCALIHPRNLRTAAISWSPLPCSAPFVGTPPTGFICGKRCDGGRCGGICSGLCFNA